MSRIPELGLLAEMKFGFVFWRIPFISQIVDFAIEFDFAFAILTKTKLKLIIQGYLQSHKNPDNNTDIDSG